MTTDGWVKPLTLIPPLDAQVISIDSTRQLDGTVQVAGWVSEQHMENVTIVDGSGELEFAAPDLDVQIGDLVLCRLLLSSGRVQSAEPRVVARPTSRARRVLETWVSSDKERAYRYRYLQLRDPHHGRMLREASRLRQLIVDFFYRRDFIYVDTPILSKTQGEYTDDDYIVVSRYTNRGVYSLPQSAQLYKQFLIGAGVCRYFQLSKCFKDEPNRTDSLTEFTQIDVEVSFSSQEALMSLAEEFIAEMFLEMKGVMLERPFLRLSIAEAYSKHGTDKPALIRDGKPFGLFITDMPMAYRDDASGLRGFHHPMMAPDPRHLPIKKEDDLTALRSTGFDIIVGGVEMGSGNMRIENKELQHMVLDHFGVLEHEREELMGSLLEGLEFAFPPHGGFAIGFERLMMILSGRGSLHEVTAFPKLRRDWCPLTRSPFIPRPEALKDYSSVLEMLHQGARAAEGPVKDIPLFPQGQTKDAPTARLSLSLSQRGGCAYPMHIGDSHLPPPPAFLAAMESRLGQTKMFRYALPGGLPELRESLASRHSSWMGVRLETNQVLISNGATEAIAATVNLTMAPDDRAMLLSPCWPLIRGQVRQFGCEVEEVPFFEGGKAPSPDRIKEILRDHHKPRTRLIYLASPNNPDGAILDPQALGTIIEFAIEHTLWVISDEVYEEQVYEPGRFVSAHTVAPTYERLVSVHSFSKSMGIPGIRVGYLIAQPKVTERLGRELQNMTYCVPSLWQYGCLAALDDLSFFERQAEVFNDARVRTARALRIPPPDGSIYHFIKVRGESASIAESLLREMDVALAPGEVGGSNYGSWLRLCFTSLPPDQAESGAARVYQWLHARQLFSN